MEPPVKRQKKQETFCNFPTESAVEQMRSAFANPNKHCTIFGNNGLVVRGDSSSFPACHIFNIFNEELMQDIRYEFETRLEFTEKNNDLYSFKQGPDIKELLLNSRDSAFSKLYQALNSSAFIKNILSRITGVQLSLDRAPDIAAQVYSDTDYLQCHDDDIAEDEAHVRRIAFIIYLVPPQWSCEKQGGQLDLFSHKVLDGDSGIVVPENVVASVEPRWNSVAFFEVSPVSFHRVREVVVPEDAVGDRLSITGWFYGPKRQVDTTPSSSSVSLPISCKADNEDNRSYSNNNPVGDIQWISIDLPQHEQYDVSKWILPAYLSRKNMEQLAKQFVDESVIHLCQFLLPSRYQALVTTISLQSIDKLVKCGPPNSRDYHMLVSVADDLNSSKEGTDTLILQEFMHFLLGSSFREWLSKVCVLSLDPRLSYGQAQLCQHGSYTLMFDNLIEPPGLDLLFHVSTTDLAPEEKDDLAGCGGETEYIDGSDHLVSVEPHDNELYLLLRDEGVARFMKYVNHRIREQKFARFAVSYKTIDAE